MSPLKNLPTDILVEIFSTVGKDSATLLGNINLRYKKLFSQFVSTYLFPSI